MSTAGVVSILLSSYIPAFAALPVLIALPLIRTRYCDFEAMALAVLLPLTITTQSTYPLIAVLTGEAVYGVYMAMHLGKASRLTMVANAVLAMLLVMVYYLYGAWKPIVGYVVMAIPLSTGQIYSLAILTSMMFMVITLVIVNIAALKLMPKLRKLLV